MKGLPHANRYSDLIVYRKARGLQQEIFARTEAFPKAELYSLTSQIRRSSRSIGAQIAEAWGKRRYENHFVSKLTDADSEQYETSHWIAVALDCGYWDSQSAEQLQRQCEEIGRLVNGMMDKASLFCGSASRTLRESSGAYFTSENL